MTDAEAGVRPGNDSGRIEELPDGSISIPVLEEELVITKRMVVRERIIVRKRTTTQEHRIREDLRRERLELDSDAEVEFDDANSAQPE